MYLIFTVMMSILFLSVLVSQHVNLDALLIAEHLGMTSIDVCSSIEAGGSAILRDTCVIVWKWLCVLPLVTCLSVMVTSHCWPFPYNYPCYLSNWHCLSLALIVEVLNAWCA